MLINIISFLFVFTIIALAHELGHLFFAKRAGIRVFEFGVGFGPRLFSVNYHNTIYSLSAIPILAFVRIAGEGEGEEDQACPPEESYHSKTIWQKFLAIFGGPLFNFVCAFLILSLLYIFTGIPAGVSNEIGSINNGSPAELAGLKIGDRLVSINNKAFPQMDKLIEFIHNSPGATLKITVERDGKLLTVSASPKYDQKLKVGLLGFSPKPSYERVNPFVAIYNGLVQTLSMIGLTVIILGKLIIGGISFSDLAGPIGIAQITGKYAASGIVSLVFFTAFISVNVGVLNLLPIPALDGGRIIFIIIEAATKKPVAPALENKINYWGFVFLLALMFIVSINDILRLFKHP